MFEATSLPYELNRNVIMETERDQKIQAYLDNEMSDSDRTEFEDLLRTDEELKKEVDDLLQLNSDLLAAGHDSFKAEVNQWESKHKNGLAKARVYNLLAIAATVAVVFFIFNYFTGEKDPDNEKLYAAYYSPYQDMILTRGESVDSENILYKGMTAYNEMDYQIAAELLEQYRINNRENYGVALYLAISQTELGRYEPAIRNYQTAMQDPMFVQQAQWYLALLYIRKNDNASAVSVLNEIRSNDEHFMNKQAEELYLKLKK